jgi:hypothetical protein
VTLLHRLRAIVRWIARRRTRGGRHGAGLDRVAQDVRYGLRQLRHSPAFSAIAIATLALGIGGITAMFSAFDAVLIRSCPTPMRTVSL